MVKSRFAFSFVLSLVFQGIAFIVFVTKYISINLKNLNEPNQNAGNTPQYWIVPILLLSVWAFFLIKDFNQVVVDSNEVTIKNLLTRKLKRYKFSELDDFVQLIEPGEPIGCPDIFLLRDQNIFGRIVCRNYKNVTEIMDALDDGLSKSKLKP